MSCSHVTTVEAVTARTAGCEECLKSGSSWVHLRLCLTCGHVGCCESSKNKHAEAHFHETGHPIIGSLEPGEHWKWCYIDNAVIGYDVPERAWMP